MPLVEGYSREAISANVSREVRRGRSQPQAVAIALSTARRAYRRRHPHGRLPDYLSGYRRNPAPRRRPNPTHYDILDLAIPALVLWVLLREGRIRPSS